MNTMVISRSTSRGGMRVVDSAEELLQVSCTQRRKGLAAARTLVVGKGGARQRLVASLVPPAAGPGDSPAATPDSTDDESVHGGTPPPSPLPHPPASNEWGSLTQSFVAFSTIPFVFLFLPQLIKNYTNLAAGNTAALAVLSYLGYLTGLGGNSLLLSYFAAKREMNAVIVQALGIASSFAVLTQIRVAGHMPHAVYAALAALVGIQTILTGLKLNGRLDGSKPGQQLWGAWQKLLGLAGLAGVPQVLWATFCPQSTSLLPSALTLAAGCAAVALEAAGALPRRLQGLWAAASAWTATALFMLQPVSQLVNNFTDPASLQGLSLATILLAACGNALMVPRALWTRDWVWLTGSMWGSLFFGWAQLLSMCLGRIPATGQRFLSLPLFTGFTVLLWGWFAAIFFLNARARRKQAAA